jgi:hypothetical protein
MVGIIFFVSLSKSLKGLKWAASDRLFEGWIIFVILQDIYHYSVNKQWQKLSVPN